MLQEQMSLVREGKLPTINVFRDSAANSGLEPPRIPLEPSRFGRGTVYVPQETGYSTDAEKIEAVMATWKELNLPEIAATVG
jgi:hypothetical protein